jgi:hypothetical protein
MRTASAAEDDKQEEDAGGDECGRGGGLTELGPSKEPGHGCRWSSRPQQPGVGEGLGLQAGQIPPHGEAGRGTWYREVEQREGGGGFGVKVGGTGSSRSEPRSGRRWRWRKREEGGGRRSCKMGLGFGLGLGFVGWFCSMGALGLGGERALLSDVG